MRLVDTRRTILLTTTLHLQTTARLAMAFTDCGCKVAVIAPPGHWVEHISRVWRRFRYSAMAPLRSLSNVIGQIEPDLIIPCDDRASIDLQRLLLTTDDVVVQRRLARSLGNPDGFGATSTRMALLALAERVSVAVPQSRAVREPPDLREWAASQPLPWVLKADGTWAGAGVRVVRSFEQAQNAFAEMSQPVSVRTAISEAIFDWNFFWLRPCLSRKRPSISVQQFIPGRSANCAVACWQGEVLACTAVEVLKAESATGPATIVRVVDGVEMRAAAEKVIASLRYTGLAGFDFIIDDESDTATLIEMNARSVPLCHIGLGDGRDLVEALTARMEQRIPRRREAVTSQNTIAFFPHACENSNDRSAYRAYLDVPWEELNLLRRLLKPSPRDRWLVRKTKNIRSSLMTRLRKA